MKKPRIHITTTELTFEAFPSKEIGLAIYCKSFKIPLEDIKYIAISPRLALDDDVLFILIIGKNHKIYKIPFVYYIYDFSGFENHFLSTSIHKEWGSFTHKDHYGKVDKIIYPKEFYWLDLFEKNWKLKVRNLYSWINPKSFFGDFSKELFTNRK